MADERTRIVAGCMTGTSLDGLDVALVKITGTGLAMKAELLGHRAEPFPDGLREQLMSLASGEAREPLVYLRAARALGELHADGIEQLLAGGLVPPLEAPLDFITAHGQTIWHAPRDGDDELGGGPKSWQLFDPWPIIHRLKVPVCYDLRQADLIAGGEGAPLTPIADWVMYRGDAPRWAVINLGGICNLTVGRERIEVHELIAEDACPCNLLLDGLVQRFYDGLSYDKDGEIARTSKSRIDFRLLDSPFFDRPRPRSTGREDFTPLWLDCVANRHRTDEPADVLAGACAAIAETICMTLLHHFDHVSRDLPKRVILAGGGARNRHLVEEIKRTHRHYPDTVILSDDLGIPCEAREAMGFAVLGALSQDGVPVSLPQVTGAKDPGVAGVWAYP